MIRVVIVDDHKLTRDGFRTMLERAVDVEVIGEARDGREAVALAQELNPDVMLMDLQMPRLNGIKATEQVRIRRANTQIVMVSNSWEEPIIREALRVGARGYVAKTEAHEELVPAIRAVFKRKEYLSTSVAMVLRAAGQNTHNHPPADAPSDKVSG